MPTYSINSPQNMILKIKKNTTGNLKKKKKCPSKNICHMPLEQFLFIAHDTVNVEFGIMHRLGYRRLSTNARFL
jgi:hypothetical protein